MINARYSLCARAMMLTGDIEGGVEVYDYIIDRSKRAYEAVMADPNYSTNDMPQDNEWTYLIFDICRAWMHVGRFSEAGDEMTNYMKYGKDNKNRSTAYDILGEVEMYQGRYKEAIDDFNLSIKEWNENGHPRANLGHCYYQQGEFQAAKDQYNNAVQSGEMVYGQVGQAICLAKDGDLTGALNKINMLINIVPDQGEYYFYRARIYALNDQDENALKDIDNSFKRGFQHKGEFNLAKNDLEPVLQSDEFRQLTANYGVDFEYYAPVVFRSSTAGDRAVSYDGTEKRLALVIGNSDYQHSSNLLNPENDANDMAAMLQQLGFDVIKLTNAGQADMKRAMDEFGR